jgi:hypothetical protein
MTVTGSVAERVAPSCNAIGRDRADNDSSPILVHSQTSNLKSTSPETSYPTTTAEMNVPANAKVRILQIFRKKFA